MPSSVKQDSFVEITKSAKKKDLGKIKEITVREFDLTSPK